MPEKVAGARRRSSRPESGSAVSAGDEAKQMSIGMKIASLTLVAAIVTTLGALIELVGKSEDRGRTAEAPTEQGEARSQTVPPEAPAPVAAGEAKERASASDALKIPERKQHSKDSRPLPVRFGPPALIQTLPAAPPPPLPPPPGPSQQPSLQTQQLPESIPLFQSRAALAPDVPRAKLRTSPSHHARVVGVIMSSDIVSISYAEGDWFYVRMTDGTTGFAHKSVLQLLDSKP